MRDVSGSEGAFQLACRAKTLVDLWAWDRPASEPVSRPARDDATRRPSFAEKRKALRAECSRRDFRRCLGVTPVPPQIAGFVERLIAQAP